MPTLIIKDWYQRNEKKFSFFALIFGFCLDAFSLRSVDKLAENIVLISYLVIVASGIFFINIYQKREEDKKNTKLHFFIIFLMQFAFGGLFSAFFVFYFRSSSFEVSFLFLSLMFLGLIGNEVFKEKYTNLVFQLSVFVLSLLSFSIFFIPTIFKMISIWTFFGAELFAGIIFCLFVFLLSIKIKEKLVQNKKKIYISIISIFVLFNIFYFSNIIPPLPLLTKYKGVFHSVVRQSDGSFLLEKEQNKFTDFFGKKTIHLQNSKPLFVFSSIYSPIDLKIDIIHSWQFYDESKGAWVEEAKIVVPIIGGREDGYRVYSYYYVNKIGDWRVDVETSSGQILSRVKFKTSNAITNLKLVSEAR